MKHVLESEYRFRVHSKMDPAFICCDFTAIFSIDRVVHSYIRTIITFDGVLLFDVP